MAVRTAAIVLTLGGLATAADALEQAMCFGLTEPQLVPFWCVIVAITLAYLAFQAFLEQQAAVKKNAVKPRRKVADISSLEAGLLTGRNGCEMRVPCQHMAKVCSELAISRGLESASLAVLLVVQRRRTYASVTAAVLPKGGKLCHIDVQLDLPSMTFRELVGAVDKALRGLEDTAPLANAETPELVFAWDAVLPENPGKSQWVMKLGDDGHIVVAGPSLAAERSFQLLFEACAASSDANVWEMPVLTNQCSQAVLAWGAPANDFPEYRDPTSNNLLPLPQLLSGPFANPQAAAVAGDGFCLSYEELLKRAGVVQSAVTKLADTTKTKTAVIYMARGEAIAPAYLGVMRAGFKVVPLDVHWPGDRSTAVAEEVEAAIVLVEPTSMDSWRALNMVLPLLCVEALLFQEGQLNLPDMERIDAEDPAMVMFTSGSTGKPKGIVQSHRYLTALCAGVGAVNRMSGKTVRLCYNSPTWMPFIDDLFAPLLNGGCTLYMPDNGSHVVKMNEFRDFANKHRATTAVFVPTVFDILMEGGLPKTMTQYNVGGALLASELCLRCVALPEEYEVYTGYSGTEIGEVTCYAMRTPEDVEKYATDRGFMGGGRPHSVQRVAILDEGFSVVGPNAVGEVCVAGPGLASGYLNLPEKTAETFLPSVKDLGGVRTARSGDLAIWTDSGNLQVIGRRDTMVKVRGARVELSEVEGTVLSHPAVQRAVVTVYKDQLVAYVVPAVPADLRDHCKKSLAAYMVPHLWEGLEELPMLPNGKVNKKALPTPKEDGAETVLELDSLGQMRQFTRKAISEDRVLDNVRAILIGIVLQAHAIPLLVGGDPAMVDSNWTPLRATWGPVQLYIFRLLRTGGWSALSFFAGFDDTRGVRPYGLTYREPLFLFLWVALGFNWVMWYLAAFAIMRATFCAAHHMGLEKIHLAVASQAWLILPAFVDLYIGWKLPGHSVIPTQCPSGCFCPFQELPWAQTAARYTLGWWVDGEGPTQNSFLSTALIMIPCYWTGFYAGASIFKILTKVADEPNFLRRMAIASSVLVMYLFMYTFGQPVSQGLNDTCSAFWGPNGFVWMQLIKNILYWARDWSMSLLYVVFIAAAVPVHLKYLAKVCFSALLFSGFTGCILNTPYMALELRGILPSAISPGIEVAWTIAVPFIYELVVGAFFGMLLPMLSKAVMYVVRALKSVATRARIGK